LRTVGITAVIASTLLVVTRSRRRECWSMINGALPRELPRLRIGVSYIETCARPSEAG
jgi:hypothetical protein